MLQRSVGSQGSNSLNLSNLEILDLSFTLVSEEQVLTDLVGPLYSLKKLFLAGTFQFGDGRFPKLALANLKQLQVLDLRANNIIGSVPEQALANLKHLRVLDLSGNSLNGSIQDQGICKLKYLQRLHLANNDLSGSLPRCLGYMTSLQVLDLSHNKLSGDVISIISNLTSLKNLSLTQNQFQGEFSFNSLLNHSKIEALMLSSSGLQVKVVGPLSPSGFQLKILGLSGCSLYMQSSTFQQFLLQQHKLLWLDISHNGLGGSFPTWLLHSNSRIQILILRNNSFGGTLLGLAAHTTIQSLAYLDISMNQFYGPFPGKTSSVMPRLGYFNASKNYFEGEISASIGNMRMLSVLDLSNNNFSGEVPSSIFTRCASLEFLKLSNNNLQGYIIPEYMNLTQLQALLLDNNHFNGTIRKGLLKNNDLEFLDLSNNKVVGGIPSWMGNFSRLTLLSMANNQLQGHIPSELFNLQELELLDLSNNSLIGAIPSYNLSWIRVLILHSNFLSGPLPVALSRSSELRILDLSENNFSGTIPVWISRLSRLNALLLGHNWLHGELSVQLCQLDCINMIDLSSNNISGVIPSCLAKMSFGKRSTNLYLIDNGFSTMLYTDFQLFEYDADVSALLSLETNQKEEVTFLTKSRYNTYEGYILGHMAGLVLSCNQLTGEIPQELGHIENIRALNLSHNRLFGSIPASFSMLRSIESLDLSYNRLSGEIPSQLVEVTTLETFNVAYNNLSGEVPETGQFATFGDRSYMGNPSLCGSYLEHKCTPFSKNDTKEEGDAIVTGFDWEVFFWSFGTSSSTILLACIVVLWINPYWRRAWFQFVDFHVLRCLN